MNLVALVNEADKIFGDHTHAHLWRGHGIEIAPGWFVLANENTGQSADVLLNWDAGVVVKFSQNDEAVCSASETVLGECEMFGRRFRIRLPRQWLVGDFVVQEYVQGPNCECFEGRNGWCEHADAVVYGSGCEDAHTGNWKIVGDEIILFDVESVDPNKVLTSIEG